VEIGGAFRMPDVMRLSGARMVEVGTTNRTRVEDYQAAITPRTAAILKVHASNFKVVGFTESVQLPALAGLAHAHGLLLLEDLGSGALLDTGEAGLASEPTIQQSLEAGVDLVACSGDKLLGGPQAGLLLGKTGLVAQRNSPVYVATKGAAVQLARALALDWAPEGIRVNAVCPGIVDTPMLREFVDALPNPERAWSEHELAQPLGRLATPAEIAAAVLFLSSAAASFITGVALPVDGGFTAE